MNVSNFIEIIDAPGKKAVLGEKIIMNLQTSIFNLFTFMYKPLLYGNLNKEIWIQTAYFYA